MNYKSNAKESSRMFKSDFLEALSKVHWSVPPLVFVPVVVYGLWKSVAVYQVTPGFIALYFFGGLFFWTLTEYVLHRFIFHWVPDSDWGKRIHFIFHGVHHDYPQDALRLVLPPSVSIPLATAFYFLFLFALPGSIVPASFSGFITGYLFYDLSHFAIHHASFKSGYLKKIKQHHMMHHYGDSTRGFGVSSALWDKIFGSEFEKK
jgi:sterol desaturase/sphingolipid hydroxylase (fatty acid hydroxylase superfamily)